MEDPNSREALRRRLRPPEESTTSLVLNGIGNGMMVGLAPFVALKMYSDISGWQNMPRNFHIASAITTVAGVAFGAFYGLKEARRLQDYRITIGNEMATLSERVTDSNEQIDSWVKKLEKHTGEHAPEIAR